MIPFRQLLPAILIIVFFIILSLQRGTPLKKVAWQGLLIIMLVSLLLHFLYRRQADGDGCIRSAAG